MLNNNISNRKAPSLLFRVEDFLVKYRETTSLDKILNKVMGKSKRAVLDEDVVHVLTSVFRTTDFTVGLVCIQDEWTKYPKSLTDKILRDLPIADLHLVYDNLDVKITMNVEGYTFYVDNSLENHSLVGHNKCITLDQIGIIARGGYKYD